MRRKAFALVAVLALVACGAAYAATAGNKYSASYTAKAKGSTKKPVATAMTEKLVVKAPSSSDRAGYPIKQIVSSISGLKAPNGAKFPECSASKINNAGTSSGKWNAVCPSKSLVASGTVTSKLGAAGNISSAGANCSLLLDVYNAGKGKLTYFLFPKSASSCDGLTKGAASAWTGTAKQSGSTLVNTVNEPADVSTEAGNQPGLWGSLESETLNWKKLTVKKSGKTYPYLESIGCKSNKRSYKTKFTDQTKTSGGDQTATVKGSSKC